ncbi:unnamed protein product [Cochlearia groenlandica]
MYRLIDSPIKLFGWTMTSSSSPKLEPHMINNESTTPNKEQHNTNLEISSSGINKEYSKETSENSDDQHSDITTTTTSEEKTTSDLKKPDKILPCPRCNSLDTKFCYYNNYNVNQPRHFCRNCQRYWTSGGSMRTVPVGSGRRKNKGWVSSDQNQHIITSEDTCNEDSNTYNSSSTKILSFDSTEADSVSQDPVFLPTQVNINPSFQGFLPTQVTSSVSPPWPYQYPPNPSFFHIPVYLGYTVPFWSTLETSTCLGKRTRDETYQETVRESNDGYVRARLDQVWCPIPMKRGKTEQFRVIDDKSETKSSNNSFVPKTYLNLQTNPAAMSRSMNFKESM